MSVTTFVPLGYSLSTTIPEPVPVTVSVVGATFRRDLPPLEVDVTVRSDGIEFPSEIDTEAMLSSIRAGRYFRCPPFVSFLLNRI